MKLKYFCFDLHIIQNKLKKNLFTSKIKYSICFPLTRIFSPNKAPGFVIMYIVIVYRRKINFTDVLDLFLEIKVPIIILKPIQTKI